VRQKGRYSVLRSLRQPSAGSPVGGARSFVKHLRLLFVDHYATTPDYPGLSRNYDICANLVALGWSASLILCRFNHSLRQYVRGRSRLGGVSLLWAYGSRYTANSWSRELNILTFAVSALLKGFFASTDVIVVTIPTLESALSAWLLASLKRVPFILNIEDLWPDSLVAMGFNNGFVIAVLRKLERFLYRRANHIFIIAENMRDHVQRSGGTSSKISLLPLGATISATSVRREQIRAQYGWDPSDIVCGYVGSHGPANSLDTIIQAAATIQDARVRFVLFGDGSDKDRLRDKAERLALANVRFMDAISPTEVPSLLRGLDIGIATLKNTNLFKGARPTKLFEYMEAGIPIVCAINGEARQLIEQVGSGVFVEPENFRGVASAIGELANDQSRRQRMGELGRHYIEEFASRDKLAAQMQSTVTEVCRRCSQGAPERHD